MEIKQNKEKCLTGNKDMDEGIVLEVIDSKHGNKDCLQVLNFVLGCRSISIE